MRQKRLIALCLGCLLPGATWADSVTFTTAYPVGETVTIGAGCESGVPSVTWQDGTTEALPATGTPSEIRLKSQTFTINAGEGRLTSLYAPNAGLTALDLTDAPHLEALVCPHNQLERLNLNSAERLTTLDVQGNAIQSLAIQRTCDELTTLNCAYNQLSTLPLGNKPKLTTLICAGNALSTLTLTNLPKLTTLWCQDNALKRLNLSPTTSLEQLYAFNNELTLISGVPATLTELWVDRNALTELDLRAAKGLKEIAIDHNSLHLVEMSSENSNSLSYFYGHNNALSFNSFPTLRRLDGYAVAPQEPFDLGITPVVGNEVDINDYFVRNAWGQATGYGVNNNFVWYDAASGTPLTEGEDYERRATGCFTFLKDFPQGVYATAYSSQYPEPIRTATAAVVPVGINDIQASNSLSVRTATGLLTVESAAPVHVKVVNAEGRIIIDAPAVSGTTSWPLTKGVYIVNGHKVLVP